jgi:hypothetical protein
MQRYLVALGLLLAGGVVGQAQNPAPDALTKRAALLKPASTQLKWQRIPWLGSLVQAQQIAQREGRPLFLWVSSDDPLDRC